MKEDLWSGVQSQPPHPEERVGPIQRSSWAQTTSPEAGRGRNAPFLHMYIFNSHLLSICHVPDMIKVLRRKESLLLKNSQSGEKTRVNKTSSAMKVCQCAPNYTRKWGAPTSSWGLGIQSRDETWASLQGWVRAAKLTRKGRKGISGRLNCICAKTQEGRERTQPGRLTVGYDKHKRCKRGYR